MLLVGATIGRPSVISAEISGRAMHAPTKSKLISSDFLTNPSVTDKPCQLLYRGAKYSFCRHFVSLPLEGKPCKIISSHQRTPSVSFSLRLGHVAALTVHRTVIHYRADTSLPYRGAKYSFCCPWVDVGIDPLRIVHLLNLS